MALLLVRTVVRRHIIIASVRTYSREEAQYWLEMSKKKDVFPKADAKFSKLDDFDEFGPPLSSSLFKTAQVKKIEIDEQVPYWERTENKGYELDVGEGTSATNHGVNNNDKISVNDFPSQETVAEIPSSNSGILIENKIFVPNHINVSMINKSRQNTPADDLFDSQDILKISHIHNLSLPSVSKVLSATMSDEGRAAIAKWEKEKIAMLGLAGFKNFKSEMFARGHTLHSMLENYMETGKLPSAGDIPDDVSKRHLVSISQTVKQFDRPIALESAVIHSKLNYHGIVDCVAMLGETLVLLDWKTSERVKNSKAALYDNPLQLAAYMGAINSDERYSRLGNLTKGVVVVVYNTGYPAMVHEFNTKQMEKYWEKWCHRLHLYQSLS